MALWLTALVVVSALGRFLVARSVAGPAIFPDELIYSDLATSFGSSGHLLVRDTSFSFWTYGPLYPILTSPIFQLPPVTAYAVVKAVNCVAMSLAAVPAYLLARRLLAREQALLAAGAAVILPSVAYSSRVMTESLAYPLFLVAVLALVRCLEQPTIRRQIVFLATILLACLARAEAIVLIPALATAAALLGLMEARAQEPNRTWRCVKERLGALRPAWIALFAFVLVALVEASLRGRGPTALLGAHEVILGRLRPVEIPKWILLHVAELDLAVGVVPFAALLILAVAAFRRDASPALRLFIAATLGTCVWLVVLIGVYATQAGVERIQERYLFYVEPLILIAFLAWVVSADRLDRVTLIAVGTAVLLPLALPFGSLLNNHVIASTPGLVMWRIVSVISDNVPVIAVVGLLAVVAGLAVIRSKNRRSLVAPVAAYLVISALLVSGAFIVVSNRSLDAGVGGGGDRMWVDRAVGSDAKVVAIWSGRGRPWMRFRRIWENEFFNRSVTSVYYLHTPLAYDLPQTPLARRGRTLVLPNGRPLRAQYVLSDGPEIAGAPISSKPRVHLTLYRVTGVVRLAT